MARVSLSDRHLLQRCLAKLPKWVPLPSFPWRSTRYSYRLHDFSIHFPWCYKDDYSKIIILNRVNDHLLSLHSFWIAFLYVLLLLGILFILTACIAVANQLCKKWNRRKETFIRPYDLRLYLLRDHFL